MYFVLGGADVARRADRERWYRGRSTQGAAEQRDAHSSTYYTE